MRSDLRFCRYDDPRHAARKTGCRSRIPQLYLVASSRPGTGQGTAPKERVDGAQRRQEPADAEPWRRRTSVNLADRPGSLNVS